MFFDSRASLVHVIRNRISPINRPQSSVYRGIVCVLICILCVIVQTNCGGGGATTTYSAVDILSHAQSATLQSASFTVHWGTEQTASGNLVIKASQVLLQYIRSYQLKNQQKVTDDLQVFSDPSGVYAKRSDLSQYVRPASQEQFTQIAPRMSSQVLTPSDILTYSVGSHDPSPGRLDHLQRMSNVSVNGYQTYHLQATFNGRIVSSNNESVPEQEDLWFRTDNFYPVQIMRTTPDGFSTLIEFINWNVPQPSPVATLSPQLLVNSGPSSHPPQRFTSISTASSSPARTCSPYWSISGGFFNKTVFLSDCFFVDVVTKLTTVGIDITTGTITLTTILAIKTQLFSVLASACSLGPVVCVVATTIIVILAVFAVVEFVALYAADLRCVSGVKFNLRWGIVVTNIRCP